MRNSEAITVIADHGGIPVRDVLDDVFGSGEEPSGITRPSDINNVDAIPDFVQFPYRPKSVLPGRLISRDFEEPMAHTPPIALVGTDNTSRKWLSQHAKKLFSIGTTVIVIAANSPEDYRALTAIYAGDSLPMTVSDELLEQYDITRYPALITQDGVYQ